MAGTKAGTMARGPDFDGLPGQCLSPPDDLKVEPFDMSDYKLYYWSVPFRGQFVRALLAFAGKTWTEAGDDAIAKLMGKQVKDMPVPFMGPPLLIDKSADVAIAQMPAIILYLGDTLKLFPSKAALRALTLKMVNDAN